MGSEAIPGHLELRVSSIDPKGSNDQQSRSQLETDHASNDAARYDAARHDAGTNDACTDDAPKYDDAPEYDEIISDDALWHRRNGYTAAITGMIKY